jgi:hypothetical protein
MAATTPHPTTTSHLKHEVRVSGGRRRGEAGEGGSRGESGRREGLVAKYQAKWGKARGRRGLQSSDKEGEGWGCGCEKGI